MKIGYYELSRLKDYSFQLSVKMKLYYLKSIIG